MSLFKYEGAQVVRRAVANSRLDVKGREPAFFTTPFPAVRSVVVGHFLEGGKLLFLAAVGQVQITCDICETPPPLPPLEKR